MFLLSTNYTETDLRLYTHGVNSKVNKSNLQAITENTIYPTKSKSLNKKIQI